MALLRIVLRNERYLRDVLPNVVRSLGAIIATTHRPMAVAKVRPHRAIHMTHLRWLHWECNHLIRHLVPAPRVPQLEHASESKLRQTADSEIGTDVSYPR
jgi:hypothetical protein